MFCQVPCLNFTQYNKCNVLSGNICLNFTQYNKCNVLTQWGDIICSPHFLVTPHYSPSLDLTPSVVEKRKEDTEETEGRALQEIQEEEKDIITVVKYIPLYKSYLSFRANYLKGRTSKKIAFQYQGSPKSGQLQIEEVSRSEEVARSENKNFTEQELEQGSYEKWRNHGNQSDCCLLGQSHPSEVEDWRNCDISSSGDECYDDASDKTDPDDVTHFTDVTTFYEGEITSVVHAVGLTPFKALSLEVIPEPTSAVVRTSDGSDSEEDGPERAASPHVQNGSRISGIFIENGRADLNVHRDMAYRHFPYVHEKLDWKQPPMFSNFL